MPHLCTMSLLKCLMSYVWPVPVWEGPGKYGPLRLAWEGGHLVVNSGNANQSYGSLHAVWQECLEEQKLTERQIDSVLILGFGAGSAAGILRKEMGISAPILGVDGDPGMLRLATTVYKVGKLQGLELVESDALAFVQAHQQQYDLVLVDLCHELDLAPGVDEEPFISGLRRCMAPGGLLCFNTIVHDELSRLRSQRVSELLRLHFTRIEEHFYQGINRVLTAS